MKTFAIKTDNGELQWFPSFLTALAALHPSLTAEAESHIYVVNQTFGLMTCEEAKNWRNRLDDMLDTN